MPKIKNIIIYAAIAVALILVYVFFLKPDPETTSLISSSSSSVTASAGEDNSPSVAKDFLTLLLSVKNIKLNDTIFSDPAFNSLRDSSITLVPDGTEGRPNPFAPLGTDTVITPPAAPAPIPPAVPKL